MSAATITSSLLGDAAVTALVGTRRALAQLPTNTAIPAVVYQVVSDVPVIVTNASAGPQLMVSRVQVTALAATVAEVESILAAVRTAMNFKSGSIAGHTVAAVVRDLSGPIEKDNEVGVWYASQDFKLTWYE